MSRKNPKKNTSQESFQWLVPWRIVCCIGLGLSAYLAISSLRGGALPGCGADSGCGTVLQTRWARVAGLPVGFGAVALYLFLLVASFSLPKKRPEKRGALAELI